MRPLFSENKWKILCFGLLGTILLGAIVPQANAATDISQIVQKIYDILRNTTYGNQAIKSAVDTKASQASVDNLKSTADAIKSKTDKLPTDPASNTAVSDAKDAIINAVSSSGSNAMEMRSRTYNPVAFPDCLPIGSFCESFTPTVKLTLTCTDDFQVASMKVRVKSPNKDINFSIPKSNGARVVYPFEDDSRFNILRETITGEPISIIPSPNLLTTDVIPVIGSPVTVAGDGMFVVMLLEVGGTAGIPLQAAEVQFLTTPSAECTLGTISEPLDPENDLVTFPH